MFDGTAQAGLCAEWQPKLDLKCGAPGERQTGAMSRCSLVLLLSNTLCMYICVSVCVCE